MISTFYKDYPNKPTAISPPKDFALPIVKPTVRLVAKPLNVIEKKYEKTLRALSKQIKEV